MNLHQVVGDSHCAAIVKVFMSSDVSHGSGHSFFTVPASDIIQAQPTGSTVACLI